MASKPQALFLLPLLLSSVTAHNITQILEPFPDFATFNNYLTQTKLADEINRRQAITVLVVDNSKMSALSSLDAETLKHVMALHVILDYYDKNKFIHIPQDRSALLTTLFQTTGIANNNLGFLNVTSKPNEVMLFGSAIPKAPLSSTLGKVAITIPYNISILQISDPIIPPGIEGAKQTSSSATPKNAPAPAPAAKPAKSTKNALAPIEKSMADAPVKAPRAVDSPADGLKANASKPLTDNKPTSNAPVASPISPKKVADMSASSSSSPSQMVVDSIVGLVINGVLLLVAF